MGHPSHRLWVAASGTKAGCGFCALGGKAVIPIGDSSIRYPLSCQLPVGLRYWPNFITEEEEVQLIHAVDGPGSRSETFNRQVFGTDMRTSTLVSGSQRKPLS